MHKTGHQGAALLAYAPVGFLFLSFDPGLAAVGALGAIALSMLPDVDMRLPLVKHRGVTHTALFAGAVAVGLAALANEYAATFDVEPQTAALLGFAVGATAVGSHLLADALTPAGVPLLWPLTGHRLSLGLATADNPVANNLLLASGVAATVAVAYQTGLV